MKSISGLTSLARFFHVFFECLQEVVKTPSRVMKIRDRLVKPSAGQVADVFLKSAEGLGGVINVLQLLDLCHRFLAFSMKTYVRQ